MLTGLFADERGEIFDAPEWGAVAVSVLAAAKPTGIAASNNIAASRMGSKRLRFIE